MHVEVCLGFALQHVTQSQSISSQSPPTAQPPATMPWFGVWRPPTASRKPILIYGAGPDLPSAQASALQYLYLQHNEAGLTSQLTLYPAYNPQNPLWSTMLGNQPIIRSTSTPNQISQGIVLRLYLARLFNPTDLPSALQSALQFCKHQLFRGMMSVPHGNKKITSEFKPISHLWIWLESFAALRKVARQLGETSLLDATYNLWLKLIVDMKVCGTPDGHWLCAGPRAWSKPDPKKAPPSKFSFQSAAGDAIYCELFQPSLRWPDKKLSGLDMHGPRLIRELLGQGDTLFHLNTDKVSVESIGMPVCVDHIVAAHSRNGDIGVYMNSPCANMTNPGPVWWSRWDKATRVIRYGVEPVNSDDRYNLHDVSKMKINESGSDWDKVWSTETSIK